MTTVAGRSLARWRSGILGKRYYAALWRTLRLSPAPIDFAGRYVFARGSYPVSLPVRTPLGTVAPTVHSFPDVQTVNEIFMREDYQAGPGVEVVVDLGSNIGISALYFMTRNPRVRCFLYEPVATNVERLRANLARFEDRYELHAHAVADRTGEVEFGVEPTGRYGGIGVVTGETIRVPCVHIDAVLESVLERTGRIDVLKIDTEGAEEATVRAIRPDLLDAIDLIYFESEQPVALHGDRFDFAFYNETCRLSRRRP
jgi:FkbM family methyltransferase